MQSYVSRELTHFVGRSLSNDEDRFALLVRIFRSGTLLDPRYLGKRNTPIFFLDIFGDGGERRQDYYPDPYFEVRTNGPVAANEFVAPEMVCFCDIPLQDLGIHTAKYSRFGFGFPKEFLLTQGANPVHYVASTAATPLRLVSEGVHGDFFAREEEDGLLSPEQHRARFLEKLKLRTLDLIARYSKGLQDRFAVYKRGKHDPVELRAELMALVEFMMGTFCYVHGLTKVFDPTLPDNDPNNFYMEREWRVIGRVAFKPSHVARVLVPRGYGDRFRREEPSFQGDVTEL
jgi:hypothetical protein